MGQHPITEWIDVHTYWDASNQMDHWRSGQHFPQNVTLSQVPAGTQRATLRWLWVCKYTDEVFVSCIDIDVVSGAPTPEPIPTPVPSPTPGAPPTPSPPSPSGGAGHCCFFPKGACGCDAQGGWCDESEGNCQTCNG